MRGHFKRTSSFKEIKSKAHLLYNKYLKRGSPFEVNIAYGMRGHLQNKLDDKELLMEDDDLRLTELVEMFDDVKKEMMRLMVQPFSRLKSGPDFETLQALLTKPEHKASDYLHAISEKFTSPRHE